jgi:hypothetical protein
VVTIIACLATLGFVSAGVFESAKSLFLLLKHILRVARLVQPDVPPPALSLRTVQVQTV